MSGKRGAEVWLMWRPPWKLIIGPWTTDVVSLRMSYSPLRTPWNWELLTSTLLLPDGGLAPGSVPLLFATKMSSRPFGSQASVATLQSLPFAVDDRAELSCS